MSWLKLDDQFPDHPKVVQAGRLAAWLHVCGMAYCARYLTDGFIPAGQIEKLTEGNDSQELAAKLVEVGLWEMCDGGYAVHDYLEYNPSAAEVKAKRKAAAKRQEEWRNKQRAHDGRYVSNAVTNSSPTALVTPIPSPSPSPSPVPDPKEGTSEKKPRSRSKPPPPAVRVFRESTHRYPPKAWYQRIADTVGEEEARLREWGEVCVAYVGMGWNPMNVKNMLEFYVRGDMPGNTRARASPADEPRGYSGIREYAAKLDEEKRDG